MLSLVTRQSKYPIGYKTRTRYVSVLFHLSIVWKLAINNKYAIFVIFSFLLFSHSVLWKNFLFLLLYLMNKIYFIRSLKEEEKTKQRKKNFVLNENFTFYFCENRKIYSASFLFSFYIFQFHLQYNKMNMDESEK